MAKLYVFGIGGTGSRVIKSLAMLLASGVKLNGKFDTVVPLIVDPDTANGDLNRTIDILIKYQNIYNEIGTDNNFFGTKIKTLNQLLEDTTPTVSDHFKFGLTNTGEKFNEFIGYNGLDEENRALIDLLFSENNIAADMTVGFKGNPNIGSVVLNKFTESDEYKNFCNTFNEGDAVFIVSSIFGGTGASGFPLLLKNLRENDAAIHNSNFISQCKIGAISYLPYFKVAESSGTPESEIDSKTFYSKAKAALNYYEHSIFNKKDSLSAFYYLGDHSNNIMPYAEGKSSQKNNAHFLELTGALSVVDFVKNIDTFNNNSSIIKEFGIEEDSKEKLVFKNLGEWSKDTLMLPIAKFVLFDKFLTKSLKNLKESKGSFKGENGVELAFYNKDFYNLYLSKFLNYFSEWIDEMDDNDISFAPFHDNQEHKYLLDFIKETEVSRGGFLKTNNANGDIIIKELHKIISEKKFDNETVPSRFIKSFDVVLENQINTIIH
ncbi:hypothetical protein FHR24_001572 [Wenyingzhuangia heitensis]|uniref:Tubulin/FtsZ family, GTPase domain n=1 Tax=Wenyingzhuangia heitensis TaxID=1487859 RepID=A0ABX0U8G9_9FLAO|nr:hypothetical protein [Wenyingzhuangia heitensis]NIJ45133.1 hypothetical protein [Wenyingzhuangia heitensis]